MIEQITPKPCMTFVYANKMGGRGKFLGEPFHQAKFEENRWDGMCHSCLVLSWTRSKAFDHVCIQRSANKGERFAGRSWSVIPGSHPLCVPFFFLLGVSVPQIVDVVYLTFFSFWGISLLIQYVRIAVCIDVILVSMICYFKHNVPRGSIL